MFNPLTKQPGRPHFVMLDDAHGSFYDIDYETAYLGKTCPWVTLALHAVPDPAIVFLPGRYFIL